MSRATEPGNTNAGSVWIKMAAAKRWCFTLNNYTESDLKRIKESLTEEECTYAVVGKETGKKGTKHLQGFVNFKRKIRLNQVKMYVTAKAHLEKSKGTDIQNKAYCTKDGEIFIELGVPANVSEKGGGSSMKVARVTAQKISEGASIEDIAQDDDMWVSYVKHSKVIRELSESKKQTKIREKAKEDMKNTQFKRWQASFGRNIRERTSPQRGHLVQ